MKYKITVSELKETPDRKLDTTSVVYEQTVDDETNLVARVVRAVSTKAKS